MAAQKRTGWCYRNREMGGGNGPFYYTWEHGSFQQNPLVTESMWYKVRVMGMYGCGKTDSIQITIPSELQPTIMPQLYPDGQAFSCDTCNDGVLTLDTIIGGVAPYSILWSDGSTGSTMTNIYADSTISIVITDALGCFYDNSGSLPRGDLSQQGVGIDIEKSSYAGGYNVSCFGCMDGWVQIHAYGGLPPYTFLWADGDTSRYRTGMGAGTYSITVTESGGHSGTREVVLIGPSNGLDAQITNMTTVSNGVITGGLNAMVNGGVPPYSYVWKKDGSVLANTWSYLSVSQTGTYSLKVTDATNGVDSTTVVVSLPIDTAMEEATPPAWGMYGNSGNGDILEGEGAPWFGTADSTDVVMKANGVPQLRLGANGVMSVEGLNEIQFTYGPDGDRIKSVLSVSESDGNGGTQVVRTETRYYAGSYEKLIIEEDNETQVYELHYVQSPVGLTAIHVKQNGGLGHTFYVYTDYLGSITELTDEDGDIVLEQNFDAWGRSRNPDNWTYDLDSYIPPTVPSNIPDPSVWLNRGYTGHEHLDEFALINMNNRMYDPTTGRMLAVDNYVADTYSTQAFNRYSYVMNNPLRYVDPTGEYGTDPPGLYINVNYSGAISGSTYNATGTVNYSYINSSGQTVSGIVNMNMSFNKETGIFSGNTGLKGDVFSLSGKPVSNNLSMSWSHEYLDALFFKEEIQPRVDQIRQEANEAYDYVESLEKVNQENVDFGSAVVGGLTTVFETSAKLSDFKAAGVIGGIGNVVSVGAFIHAVATDQAKPAHYFDVGITSALIIGAAVSSVLLPPIAPYVFYTTAAYGGFRLILGDPFDNLFNSQWTTTPVLTPNRVK